MEVGELVGVVAAALASAGAADGAQPGLHHRLRRAAGAAGRPHGTDGQGIVGGDMAWPLVIVGMLFGVALILIKAPAPMLIAVGMYLPFSTTSAVLPAASFAPSRLVPG